MPMFDPRMFQPPSVPGLGALGPGGGGGAFGQGGGAGFRPPPGMPGQAAPPQAPAAMAAGQGGDNTQTLLALLQQLMGMQKANQTGTAQLTGLARALLQAQVKPSDMSGEADSAT